MFGCSLSLSLSKHPVIVSRLQRKMGTQRYTKRLSPGDSETQQKSMQTTVELPLQEIMQAWMRSRSVYLGGVHQYEPKINVLAARPVLC